MVEIDDNEITLNRFDDAGKFTARSGKRDDEAGFRDHIGAELARWHESQILFAYLAERLRGRNMELFVIARFHTEERLFEAGQKTAVPNDERRRSTAARSVDFG